jgi:type II secretory pathway component PulF
MVSQHESLSASQLAMLLEEVAQMARAQRPLAPAFGELNRRGMGRLGRVAGKISQRLAAGEPPERAIAAHAGRLRGRTSAALSAVTRTGWVEPVYRLARALRDREQVRMQGIAASLYPAISILIAYLLLSLVMTSVVIQSHAGDVITLRGAGAPGSSAAFIRFAEAWRSAFWVPPVIVGAALFFWLVLARWHSGDATMPWLVRGVKCHRWSEFCESMGDELEAGSLLDVAVRTSAVVAGNARFATRTELAADRLFRSAHVGAGANEAQSSGAVEREFFPPLIAWMLARQSCLGNHQTGWAAETSAAEWAEQWRMLAQWYRQEGIRLTRGWVGTSLSARFPSSSRASRSKTSSSMTSVRYG